MKKIMLCAAVIVAAMAMTGCKKVCKCSATVMGITTPAVEFDLSNSAYSAYKSCNDLQKDLNKFMEAGPEASYSCK